MNDQREPIFINREREIDKAAGLADALRNEIRIYLRYPILYFYGAPMIGKSALLNKIRATEIDKGWGVHLAYLDWNEQETQQNWANQLCQQVYAVYEREHLGIDPRRQPNKADSLKTAWEKTLDLVKNLPEKNGRFLWLFDTLEKIPLDDWRMLQTGLLGLLESGRFGLILAGRLSPDGLEESRLLSFEYAFARLIERIELKPLDESQTLKHFQALNYPAPEFAYLQTGGVPGLNKAFATENGDLQRAIQHGLLPHIRAGYRDALPQPIAQVWEWVRRLAVYRTFDAEIAAAQTESREDPASLAYLESGWRALESLLAQHYIEKLPGGSGYRVVQALRPAILATHTLDARRDLHRAAALGYQKRMNKGDYDAAIDWLYHSIGAATEPLSRADLQTELESILNRMRLPQTQINWLEKTFLTVLREESQDWQRLNNQTGEECIWMLNDIVRKKKAELMMENSPASPSKTATQPYPGIDLDLPVQQPKTSTPSLQGVRKEIAP